MVLIRAKVIFVLSFALRVVDFQQLCSRYVDLCQEPDILLLVIDIMSYYKVNVYCFADRMCEKVKCNFFLT